MLISWAWQQYQHVSEIAVSFAIIAFCIFPDCSVALIHLCYSNGNTTFIENSYGEGTELINPLTPNDVFWRHN